MKNEGMNDRRWITVRGNHVLVKYSKKTIQAFGNKGHISPFSENKVATPISTPEIKNRSKNLPAARELKDALKEKYSSDELRAEMKQMHEKSIRLYGEASGNYGAMHFKDVTEEVIENAKPGDGRVFTEFTNEEENDPEKAAELEDAKMIAKYLGGDIVHLKERSDVFRVDELKTADYMHNGNLIDRKNSSGGSAITGRIRKGSYQIMTPTYSNYDGRLVKGKPGGILIAVTRSADGGFRNNKEICKNISKSLAGYKGPVPYPLRIMIKRGSDDLVIVEVTKA